MRVLGIEGTAHTFAAGIVEYDDPRAAQLRPRTLANVIDMHRPDEGGIHPRVAADHHADVAGRVIRDALARAGLAARDLDLVAFSRGPGLGPCLRMAATAARAFALSAGKPLIGVNHCVAHLEIGRAVTPAEDPILLYASGGNTQVIGFHAGRYRVFGETLDVGVGNMLDKFARDGLGLPFPGGPKVEELAARATGPLVDLPYTVKGMDVAFSGLLTAAKARLADAAKEDVCHALQETAFGMLVEVTERALAHAEKDEVVLGGGVACNARLRAMAERMAADRGATAWTPEKALCVDNGVMIAHLGAVMHRAGVRQALAETAIDQRERTDDIAVTWRAGEHVAFASRDEFRGAEAVVTPSDFLGRAAMRKVRSAKAYRHPSLDRRVASDRTRREARFLSLARKAGVRTPVVYDVDAGDATLVMERLGGRRLKEGGDLLEAAGEAIARLHAAGLVHGDLTTSNLLAEGGGVALIDFGLAAYAESPEDLATDLHVLREALAATHADAEAAFVRVLDGYRAGGGTKAVEASLAEIVRRGRYRGT